MKLGTFPRRSMSRILFSFFSYGLTILLQRIAMDQQKYEQIQNQNANPEPRVEILPPGQLKQNRQNDRDVADRDQYMVDKPRDKPGATVGKMDAC